MSQKNKRILPIIVVSAITLFFFQNCGDVVTFEEVNPELVAKVSDQGNDPIGEELGDIDLGDGAPDLTVGDHVEHDDSDVPEEMKEDDHMAPPAQEDEVASSETDLGDGGSDDSSSGSEDSTESDEVAEDDHPSSNRDESKQAEHKEDNGQDDEDHGKSEDDHGAPASGKGSHQAYLCILEGPGASVRLGLSHDNLEGVRSTPKDVCISKRACLELVSLRFKVKAAKASGVCKENGNPHVTHLDEDKVATLLGL